MENISKPFSKRIWDFLGSRSLSVFIFVMAFTYILILTIFATIIPTPWVNRIATLLPFNILHTLFFINLLICEIKWLPVVIKRCKMPVIPETVEELQRFRSKIQIQYPGFEIQNIERYLRKRRYNIPVIRGSDKGQDIETSALLLYACKGRFSSIGNLLFHAAFLLLPFGVWLGAFKHFEGTVSLFEGQMFTGQIGEYSTILSNPAGLPPIAFDVEKIVPEFWQDRLLFTDLRAEVSYIDAGDKKSGLVRLSKPQKINGANITMSGIGYLPMYILSDKSGQILDSGYVKMNIFPPGTVDHFQVPGYPHQIFVAFYPDYEMKDGRMGTRSINLNNPAYFIRVFRNKILSYSSVVKPGEEAYFEGLKLSFPQIKYWGTFKIVKDPGFTFIWVAFVLFGAGLVWRLLFHRSEVAVRREGDTLYLYGNSDYYHRLFEDRLKMLAEGWLVKSKVMPWLLLLFLSAAHFFCYKKGLDINPCSVAPCNNLCIVYAAIDQHEEAEKWF